MPLPQKVIERLGREPPKTPGWSGGILMFSGTLFFFSLFVYIGLAFGYKPYLNSEVKELQSKIQAFGQQIPLEEQKKLINFYSQLANLKVILQERVFTSHLFPWLENNTQANIYYEDFSLDVSKGAVKISGAALSMEDINQQLAIFVSLPELRKTQIDSATFAGGLWRFNATIFFREDYFNRGSVNL